MINYKALVYVNDIEICYETLCIDVRKEGGVLCIRCRKDTDQDYTTTNYLHSKTISLLSAGHIINLSVIHDNSNETWRDFEFPASLSQVNYDAKGEMSSVTFQSRILEIAS